MTYVIQCRVFALLLFLPFFSAAQQTDTSGVVPDRENRLKEVVIQATRTTANGAIPHNNFSAEKISQSLQAQDVPMLLSATPSLVESSDAGIGTGYTGLRIRGSDPTRVNVTINGVPLNDAESQGMYWVDLPDLAASAAEIQVQRGVGASTNGAGAFGATVNVDLSRVAAAPGAEVSSTIGAFGTRKFSARANTGLLAGKWAFSGRASEIHSDGFIDRASADLNSLHLSGAFLGDKQSLQVHFLAGHEITYQAWNGTPAQFIDDETLRRFNTAGTEKPGEPYRNEVDDYTQRHLLLHFKRNLTPQLTLQLNGHYTKGAGYYEQYKADQDYADYGLTPWVIADSSITTTDLVRRRWLDNDFYGGTFALRWRPDRKKISAVMLGGALSRYTGRHFGEIIWSENPTGQSNDFRYYDNDADKRDANLYLKTELSFTRRLRAFIDLQGRVVAYEFLGYDQNLTPTDQSVRHYFFNPKAGITYSMTGDWTAYGFFGIGHREPNRDDYTQSSPATRPKAESLADGECGLRYEGAQADASLNFFLMSYRNQLVLDGRINDVGAYIRTNVPDSYRAGVELEGNVRAGSRMSFGGNLALSRNRIRAFAEYIDNWDTYGQERVDHRHVDLAFSPALIARVEGSVLLWGTSPENAGHRSGPGKMRASATLSAKYVGKQFLDNTSSELAALPAYISSDLRLNFDFYQWTGMRVNFILSLNNWLDQRYASNGWVYRYISAGYDARPDDPYARLEGGNVYQQAGFFPQAGRHLMATISIGIE